MHYTLQLYLTYYALQLYLTYYALQLYLTYYALQLYFTYYALQLYFTYYALQLYLTYYALQLLFLQTVLVEYGIEVIFIICSQITLFKTQSSIWWKMCTQKTISIHISSLYHKLNAVGENGLLLLLPNTDPLQQVENYVRCCTTSTKYWPPSTSWRLCQMLHYFYQILTAFNKLKIMSDVALLLPNTDRLQQVEDYVRCCTWQLKTVITINMFHKVVFDRHQTSTFQPSDSKQLPSGSRLQSDIVCGKTIIVFVEAYNEE